MKGVFTFEAFPDGVGTIRDLSTDDPDSQDVDDFDDGSAIPGRRPDRNAPNRTIGDSFLRLPGRTEFPSD